jgi:hypothetical protein
MKEPTLPPNIEYRVIFGGIGIVCEGASEREAKSQFNQSIVLSQTAGSRYLAEPVTLFENLKIIAEYRPPDSFQSAGFPADPIR